MKKLMSLLLAGLLLVTTAATAAAPYANNRAPLREKPFVKLPLGAIRAEGWLRDQLQRQADGLTGHLDSVYPEVMGPRNGWLGGDGDVWERGPYWIDGLLPLAYILGDERLIEKTRPWVEWALGSRQPDGYFGPAEDRPFESPAIQRDNARDWWPKMVMLKVLQQYYSATGDERVIELMSAYFRYQLRELPKTPLGHWTFWGEQRGGDNLGIVYWLYNITGDEFLLELGDLIHRQTFDWTGILAGGEVIPTPFSLHCVNLAQGIKEPVVYYQRSNDPAHVAAVKKGFEDIRRYIGLPTGLYGGDEALHGAAPTQGSELCTAVEMMYSLEEMAEITGDVQFADHLERVAFNALPTQATDAYDARQYYQQVNQVMITDHRRNFEQSHDGTDILYGLLTGYACCTSNMHQGWPKFTQNLWYATHDGGLAAMVYSPCNVTAEVAGGVRVTIAERTQYPFDEQIRFEIRIDGRKVKTAEFPLRLRIPGWCEGATVAVNGQAVASPGKGSVAEVRRAWRSACRWRSPSAAGTNARPSSSAGRWSTRCASANNGRKSATRANRFTARGITRCGLQPRGTTRSSRRTSAPNALRRHSGSSGATSATPIRGRWKTPRWRSGRAGADSTNGCSTRRAPAPSRTAPTRPPTPPKRSR